MAVRSAWLATLSRTHPLVLRSASELASSTPCTPVDLPELSSRLGARIRTLPTASARKGGLSRDGDGWIIWTDGKPSCLDVDKRFTVAHELAHLLFIRSGLSIPIGAEEYWILESACDQGATEILIPSSQAPSQVLDAGSVVSWHDLLIDTWNVAPWIAADSISRHASNICASAVVSSEHSRWGYVEWSTGQETVKDWPIATLVIDRSQFGDLHQFMTSTLDTNRVSSQLEVSNGTLVGINSPGTVVLYFLSRAKAQRSLFYSLFERDSSSSGH